MYFYKLQGAGNDYIFVDCFDNSIDDKSKLAIKMSDRHFGIGGDGVIFLYPSFTADVRMRMFNSDGSEGAMCGNAVRCIGRLFYDNYAKANVTVETNSGIKTVSYDEEKDLFTVNMGKPTFSDEINKPIFVSGKQYNYTFVNMGNPHCVIFVSDVKRIKRATMEAIQSHSFFPGGINVEFVQIAEDGLNVRVCERGSGETLSCGTGACAAVAASVKCGLLQPKSEVKVSLLGGDLIVKYSENIYLTGNAEKVYEGDYYDKVHFCNRWSCKRTW
ncbi:MAG: diaminopimelate epimerase [Clostridia bacterium]|nr:diaminopimelate epimerase [Clostridia bacterium]